MENQHRQITGYRDLSAEEITLMNRIKDMGAHLEELCARVRDHVRVQRSTANSPGTPTLELARLDRTEPERWAAIARTDFQTALMALTRAVAQPTTF